MNDWVSYFYNIVIISRNHAVPCVACYIKDFFSNIDKTDSTAHLIHTEIICVNPIKVISKYFTAKDESVGNRNDNSLYLVVKSFRYPVCFNLRM